MDDLMARLGIDPSKIKTQGQAIALSEDRTIQDEFDEYSEGLQSPNTESYCLELDKWDKQKGVDLWEDYTGDGANLSPEDLADFHASFFLPDPALKDRNSMMEGKPVKRHDFLTEAMESPNMNLLRKKTIHNKDQSEIAARQMAEEFSKLIFEKEEDHPESLAAFSHAVEAAVLAASEEVQMMEDTAVVFSVCGPRKAMAASNTPLNSEMLQKVFAKIQESKWLRDFMKLAGKYRETAYAKQRTRLQPGNDEVTGITQGRDLTKVLPTELMLLMNPETEVLGIRRFLEGQMLMRETQTLQKMGEGAIVVAVDGSGSMAGDCIQNAKSLALAMWWIAQHQKRYCFLSEFGSESDLGYNLTWAPNDKGFANNPQDVLTWVEHFYDANGTSYHVPLVDIPAHWKEFNCPKGKTDMVIISDGLVKISDKEMYDYIAWKNANQVSLYTLLLGCTKRRVKKKDKIEKISDRVFYMDDLDMTSSAVSQCLSV